MRSLWRDYACDSWIPSTISGEVKNRDEMTSKVLWRNLLSNEVISWETYRRPAIFLSYSIRDTDCLDYKREWKKAVRLWIFLRGGNMLKNYSAANMFYPSWKRKDEPYSEAEGRASYPEDGTEHPEGRAMNHRGLF